MNVVEMLQHEAGQFGVSLSDVQIQQFRRYYDEMSYWNSRVNLTRITGWEEVQQRHFVDSLTVGVALPDEVLRLGGKVLDVGSGAGLPGLPLKIAYPRLQVTLLESKAKKTAFLKHVARVLELEGLEVLTGRAEDLAHQPTLREAYDVVVSRAVAKVRILVELCLPFCRVGALTIAQKTLTVGDEVKVAGNAIREVGGQLREVIEVGTKGAGERRTLVLIEKTVPTSQKYPRRAGMPAKSPL